MATMDLKQDYRDEDGELYRAGPGREVPEALARRIGADRTGGQSTAGAADDSIAEDFPGQEHLAAVGIVSRTQLRNMSDDQLKAVKGIGEKGLGEIRGAQG